MKKQIVSVMLAVMMLLCFLPAAVSATAPVTLAEQITMEKGYGIVTWNGNANGIYYLYTQCLDPVSGAEQPLEYNNLGAFNSCELDGLVPGHVYDVYLVNKDEIIIDKKTYEIPAADPFEDEKLKDTSVKVTIETRKKTSDESIKSISELKAANIARDLGNESAEYGFKYTMKMPQLKYERSYHMVLAVIAPNGMISSIDYGDLTFDRVADGYQTLWANFTGNWIFSAEYKAFGSVPSGKYTVELYWDGMLVNRQAFTVN